VTPRGCVGSQAVIRFAIWIAAVTGDGDPFSVVAELRERPAKAGPSGRIGLPLGDSNQPEARLLLRFPGRLSL